MKFPLVWCLGWVLLLKNLSTESLVCQPSVQSTGFCLVACLLGGTSTSASWNPAWIPGWLPERRQDVSSRPWISHLTLWRPLWGLVENHLERNLRLKQSQVTEHRKQLLRNQDQVCVGFLPLLISWEVLGISPFTGRIIFMPKYHREKNILCSYLWKGVWTYSWGGESLKSLRPEKRRVCDQSNILSRWRWW